MRTRATGKRLNTLSESTMEVSLEKIHLDILQLLLDNLPEDLSETGEVSRKILFQSVNHKPRQIEKACNELESRRLM